MTQAYRELRAVNQSALKQLKISEKHFIQALEYSDETTNSQKLGTLTHQMVLEPHKKVVVYEGVRRGKEWDAFQLENADALICIQSEYDKSIGMVNALKNYAPLRELLNAQDSLFEHAETFVDTNTGLTCKRLTDIKNERLKVIADIKTCATLEFNQLQSAAFKYGYHNQADFYKREREHFDFIIFAVESKPPYDVAHFKFDDDLLEFAKHENDELLAKAKIALQKDASELEGQYPNNGMPMYLSFPKWKAYELEQENEEFNIEEELS